MPETDPDTRIAPPVRNPEVFVSGIVLAEKIAFAVKIDLIVVPEIEFVVAVGIEFAEFVAEIALAVVVFVVVGTELVAVAAEIAFVVAVGFAVVGTEFAEFVVGLAFVAVTEIELVVAVVGTGFVVVELELVVVVGLAFAVVVGTGFVVVVVELELVVAVGTEFAVVVSLENVVEHNLVLQLTYFEISLESRTLNQNSYFLRHYSHVPVQKDVHFHLDIILLCQAYDLVDVPFRQRDRCLTLQHCPFQHEVVMHLGQPITTVHT